MLIRFEVGNFRSILEPVELSMVAIDRDREAARRAPALGRSLLTVAAVYGPNASGKTNLVVALTWLARAVQNSALAWTDGIPAEPFAFDAGPERDTSFALEMLVDGVRFEYVLDLNSREVVYEALFHHPVGRRRRLFEREGDRLTLRRGLGALSGVRDLLTERTLVLTAARRHEAGPIRSFADRVVRLSSNAVRTTSPDFWPVTSMLFRTDSPGRRDTDQLDGSGRRRAALALLRFADLGVQDVRVEEEPLGGPGSTSSHRLWRTRLVHRVGEDDLPLDFALESNGTRSWYSLIAPVLDSLRLGSVLVLDELDASLHPVLSAQLVEMFHAYDSNPRGAQLVFTTHDTSLLNHLNRDEVWLTEKGPDGATRLGSIADFTGEQVRRSTDLEKAYLRGRFGAIPEGDHLELLRALG